MGFAPLSVAHMILTSKLLQFQSSDGRDVVQLVAYRGLEPPAKLYTRSGMDNKKIVS